MDIVCAAEVIHGKTGPLPKGAVLFGPFSYARDRVKTLITLGGGSHCLQGVSKMPVKVAADAQVSVLRSRSFL